MYLRVRNEVINTIHEYIGLAFVVVGVAHLILNFRPLVGYVKNAAARISIGLALGVLVVLAIVGVAKQENNPNRKAQRFIENVGK